MEDSALVQCGLCAVSKGINFEEIRVGGLTGEGWSKTHAKSYIFLLFASDSKRRTYSTTSGNWSFFHPQEWKITEGE